MASQAHTLDGADESPDCLTGNLGWLLAQAEHAYASELAVALAPLGVGSRGFCVLSTAMRGAFTQKQLADIIGLDKTTMVVTLDQLEQAGLARRTPSSTDRRARVVVITKAGERKVAEGQRIIDAVQSDVLGSLPAREREALVDGLIRLVTGRLADPPVCDPPLRRREARA
jgi:DNA-binding MarR family transcriptional regulator